MVDATNVVRANDSCGSTAAIGRASRISSKVGRRRSVFRAIEHARGRVEAQALEDHEPVAPHEPTTAEKLLTNLNLRLLDTDDVGSRQNILQTIYDTEQQINSNFKPDHFSTEPADLAELQSDLSQS